MARLSTEKILEIKRLYKEIGIYSQVAKMTGCSAATVKKYAAAAEEADSKEYETLSFDKEIPDIMKIDLTFFRTGDNLTTLTESEIERMKLIGLL